jgi:hypothetical protein
MPSQVEKWNFVTESDPDKKRNAVHESTGALPPASDFETSAIERQ